MEYQAIGVGIAIIVVVWRLNRDLKHDLRHDIQEIRQDIRELRQDFNGVRERVAKLETARFVKRGVAKTTP